MRPGNHAARRLVGCQTGAQGKPAADPLGDGHDVGCDPRILMRKKAPRAAHAALNFVCDQKQTVLIAKRTQPFQKGVLSRNDTTLALYRLDQDGGRGFADGLSDRVKITERDMHKTGKLGAKTVQQLFTPRRRDHA